MIYQFQQHIAATLGTKQGIFTEAIDEALVKRFWRQNPVTSGIDGYVGRNGSGKVFSDLLVTNIAMQSVISDSLKALRQDVLYHSCNELDGREGLVLDLTCFVVSIPVAYEFSIISFNSAYRNRWGYDILCQILSQTFSARGHFCLLQKGDKTIGVICPCPVDVFFNIWVGNVLPEHFQQMVLPFSVHHIVWDVTNRFPFAFFIKSSCGHEDMKVGVVMSGASGSLQDDNVTYIEFFYPCTGLENIFDTGMSCPHKRAEQFWVAKEPDTKKFGHGQDYMSISYDRQQSSSDEVRPSINIDLCAGKTEAGLTGESNTACLSTVAAAVLHKAHLFGITAVKHFLDCFGVVRAIKMWGNLSEGIPVIMKYLFECVFFDAFHGCFLRTKIIGLAG